MDKAVRTSNRAATAFYNLEESLNINGVSSQRVQVSNGESRTNIMAPMEAKSNSTARGQAPTSVLITEIKVNKEFR